MRKTIVRTYTEDTADGAIPTESGSRSIATYTERVEEQEPSGVMEVGIGLVFLTSCLILLLFSWAIASSLANNNNIQTENHEKNHAPIRQKDLRESR